MLRPIPAGDHIPASDLLEGLNERQREAVATIDGPLLIIAGAGSGKTRVLTYRIAYLLRMGVHPSHVLALTFTNRAAQEMKDRIGHLVGDGIARGIWAGTFHSLFARILRKEAERIGYTNSFTIYDTDDQLAAIKAVMTQLGVSQQVLPPNGVRSRISGFKNNLTPWQEAARNADTLVDKQTAQIYEEYEKRLRQSNAMDFDDLLLNMIRLLENHEDALKEYQQRFKYIMVDEYQDTNRVQYRAVNLLAGTLKNLCVVGDDAQSIYRWRGADIRNILDFERDYPDAKVVRLEQNYRSTKVILAAADSVIKNNIKQLKKTLWTDNHEGEKITLLPCRDDREEAELVARTIKDRMQLHGYTFKDVAILYRTNAQSQALEDALRRMNLPYHIVSGVSFYKRKEVKDTLAYLRLLVNPNDTESLLRIVNEPTRGIGATSLERLQERAVTEGRPLIEILQSPSAMSSVQKRTQTAISDFVDIINRHRDMVDALPPATVAQQYIEATGLPQMYKLQDTEESLDRWNNIERVLSHIYEQQELDESLTLTTYLEQIALLSDADDPQIGSNRIGLMTMHAAKGLEFPLVVIAGLEQGLFPLAKADTDINEQEEERRLFYVGITRARKELVLSYAERRYRFGELVFNRPSMFLAEIDKDSFAEMPQRSAAQQGLSRPIPNNIANRGIDKRPTKASEKEALSIARFQPPTWKVAKPRGSSNEYAQEPGSGESYSQVEDGGRVMPGQRVKHPMFGVGTVTGVSGVGQHAKATVMFQNGQKKNLMLAYARLELIG